MCILHSPLGRSCLKTTITIYHIIKLTHFEYGVNEYKFLSCVSGVDGKIHPEVVVQQST